MIHGALRDGRRRAANAPSTRFAFICSRPTAWPCRAFATSSSLAQGPTPITSASLRNANRPKADKKRLAPKPGSKPLTAQQRLERCLPPHLRNNADGIAQDETPFDPDPLETAKLALESFTGGKGFLTYLAIDQGRWRAAVWLVKLLIEHFHSPPARSSRSSQLIQEWTRTESLDDITEHPVYLNPFQDDHVVPHIKTSTSATLHELTDGSPDTFSGMEMLRHRILGLLWRDIGRLIIVCSSDTTIAGGQVKPDVLEMIALLHHYELMPDSIYTYNPPQSEDAIYQPPTLPLLSHRIFEALSDAAWRAREMSALEEAKKKVGGPVTLEARGSSIRARIPGVKPEVWLELILWSCLHGGWISDGASLLNSLYRSRAQEKWTTISWRDSLNAVVPPGQHETSNWDSVSSMFDARSSPKMHGVDVTGLRVHKTVSSEVVNAYIDALMTTVKLGVGDRGTDLDIVLRQLRSLRKLLQRTNLNLGGGSWDAMILRLVESGAISLDEDPAIVQHLATLSPTIGEELQSRRSQAVPSYVLDGSAAMLGLLHRALRTEIKNGNLEGALKVFRILQERVDNDMHQSMSDFFANKHLSSESEEIEDPSKGMFTSNFSGIDYPSFSMQIPPSILAAFLDLVTDTKSYSLGNWMLGIDNRDIDGPLIPLSLYSDPLISAAIVHFAATTENTALLSKITEEGAVKPQSGDSHDAPLPKELLQAFLDVQVNVRHWDSAEKLLEYMRDTEGLEWNPRNAATMAKVLIIESQASSAGKPGSDFHRAEILFTSLLMGRYGDWKIPPDPFVDVGTAIQRDHIESICVMASFVSPKLAATMHRLELLPKKFDFRLRSRPFMSILEAVVTTQNSEAGRALVDKFALYHEQPKEYRSRRSQPASLPEDEEAGEYRDALSEFDAPATTRPRMPRTLEAATEADIPSRRTIAIEIAGDKLNYKRNTIMYGGFSIRGHGVALTVVRKALAERAEQRANALSNARSDEQQQLQKSLIPSLDIFAWALITLRRAGVDRSALIKELENPENGLTDDEMQAVEQLAMDQWQAITDEWMARERDEPLPINRGYFLG